MPRAQSGLEKGAGPRRANYTRLERLVNRFNRACPVGSAVAVRTDEGRVVRTHTRTIARVLERRRAVVWVVDFGGAWDLDQVRRIAGRAEQ